MRGKNQVIIMGNLTDDPEQKNITGQNALVTIRVAVDETYRKNNETVEKKEYITVKVWGQAACSFIMGNMKKGDGIYVEGKFRTEKYDRNGSTVYSTFVVVNGFDGTRVDLIAGAGSRRGGSGGGDAPAGGRSAPAPAAQSQAELDDEIPF